MRDASASTHRADSRNRVGRCNFALQVTQTRSFDTEAASSSYATGFVVDKVRGLILTNRHVVTPGTTLDSAVKPADMPVRALHVEKLSTELEASLSVAALS